MDPSAIPNVPYRIRGLNENLSLTERTVSVGELAEEVEKAFGIRPIRVDWSRMGEQTMRTRSTLVTYRLALLPVPPKRIQLFAAPLRVAVRKVPPRTPQCGRCFGFHRQERCTRSQRCAECAAPTHTTEEHNASRRPGCAVSPDACKCPPCCANCAGAHKATDKSCPVRPTVREGQTVRPTRAQVGLARRANLRLRSTTNQCPGAAAADTSTQQQ